MDRSGRLTLFLVVFLLIVGLSVAPQLSPVSPAAASPTPEFTKIRVGAETSGLALGFGSVWVTNSGDGTVSRIDPATNQVVATIKTVAEPRGIAAGEGGVWVASWGLHESTVVRIDPASNEVVATIKAGKLGALEGVAISKGAVWVTNFNNGWVLKIDPKTNEIKARIKVGGQPRKIAAGEKALWVIDAAEKEVVRIDPQTDRIVARIGLDQGLTSYNGITVGGGSVWVTNGGAGGRLFRIDPGTNKVSQTYSSKAEYYGATVGGGYLWVGCLMGISQINLADGEWVEHFGEDWFRWPPSLVFGHGSLWVASGGQNVIRVDKLKVDLAEAQGSRIGEIVINQIDIANFPDVVLYVTVLDGDGNLITGLQERDFKVLEDEVEQSPITLATQLPSIAAVMAVDTSGSMRKAMPQVLRAAASFINNMRGQDQVLLLQFADKVTVANPFTMDKSALQRSIDAMKSRGNTALYDAVYQAVDSFGEKKGRKVAVVLTDGVDDDGFNRPLSRKTLKEAIAAAGEINVPIYAIGLGTEVDTGVLRRMAEETGGRYFFSPSPAELEGLYRQIVTQLEGQYRISYKTNITELDGSWHRVVVKARGSMGDKKYKAPTAGR